MHIDGRRALRAYLKSLPIPRPELMGLLRLAGLDTRDMDLSATELPFWEQVVDPLCQDLDALARLLDDAPEAVPKGDHAAVPGLKIHLQRARPSPLNDAEERRGGGDRDDEIRAFMEAYKAALAGDERLLRFDVGFEARPGSADSAPLEVAFVAPVVDGVEGDPRDWAHEMTRLVADHRRVLIVGGEGLGKTSACKRITQVMAQEEGWLPIWMEASSLARRLELATREGGGSLDQAIVEGLAADLQGRWGTWIQRHRIEDLLDSPVISRVVVVLDGLDELGSAAALVISHLNQLASHPRFSALVASRPSTLRQVYSLQTYKQLTLHPMDAERRQTLCEQYLRWSEDASLPEARARAAEFLAQLETVCDEHVASNPMLLAMALSQDWSFESAPDEHAIYRGCLIRSLCALERRLLAEKAYLGPTDPEELLGALTQMVGSLSGRSASESQWEGAAQFNLRDAVLALPREYEDATTGRRRIWSEEHRRYALVALAGTLLYPTSRDGADDRGMRRDPRSMRFAHPTYREFFYASWLLGESQGDAAALLATLTPLLPREQTWRTIRFVLGLARDVRLSLPDELMAGLLKSRPAASEEGQHRAVWLVGTALAYGLGGDATFEGWLDAVGQALERRWSEGSDACVRAWASVKVPRRKGRLLAALQRAAEGSTWVGWLRFNGFAAGIGLTEDLSLPPQEGPLVWTVRALAEPAASDEVIACGRVHFGCARGWPRLAWPLLFLSLWPGNRRSVGARLQLAANFGASREEVMRLARAILQEPPFDELHRRCASQVAAGLVALWRDRVRLRLRLDVAHLLRASARMEDPRAADVADEAIDAICDDTAADVARYYVRYISKKPGALGLPLERHVQQARALCAHLKGNMWPSVQRHLADLLRRAVVETAEAEVGRPLPGLRRLPDEQRFHLATVLMAALTEDGAGEGLQPQVSLALKQEWMRHWRGHDVPPWLEEYARVDLRSVALLSPRMVGTQMVEEEADPAIPLIRAACHRSLTSRPDDGAFSAAWDAYRAAAPEARGGDLWASLAGYIAGVGDPSQRALLEAACERPAEVDLGHLDTPLMRSGLRFIVRGDVMLGGGGVLTLDQIADELGFARLEALGDVPPPLDHHASASA